MLGVSEVASDDVASVDRDDTVESVAQVMYRRGVGSVVVEEDGELGGIVTDRDLAVELLAENSDTNVFEGSVDPADLTAADVTTTDPLTVGPDDEIPAVVEETTDAIARRIPVVENGDVVGIVALDDLVVYATGEAERLAAMLRGLSEVVEAESPLG